MVMQPPIVQEQDLLDPVSGRQALPGVANYQRRYAFYGAHQYQANRDAPLMTQLEGADLKAELSIHKAPAEYCLPVKKDRRFSPVFQTKVCFTASAQRNLDFTVYAYPLSVPERQTLEAGASGEPPHLPDALREMLVHGTPPIFVDKHTYFRAPCHIAHSHVLLQPGQETKVVIPFEGLEFVKPSSMSPMTIAFAVCVGDTRDVALVLMTPATICVCRADQRGDAAVKLGYSKTVFERVNERSGSQKYKTKFNPPTRGRGSRGRGQGGAPAAAAAQPPPSPASVPNGRPCAQDALAPPVAAAHTPAPLQPVHSVHSAPLDPFLAPWHEVHGRATSPGDPPGAAQHGAATSGAWTGPSERRASAAAAGEDTAALRWDLRRDDSLMHDLHALLEDADKPQLAAANAVSVFEGLECQITGFDDSMRSYAHMHAEAPGMSEGPDMEWDDAPLGSIGGHSGPARSMFPAAPAHQEAEGGYAPPDFSLGDLSSFPAEPMPAPEAPQPAPEHAVHDLPEHAVHELPEHAAHELPEHAALPAPAPAAAGGTAYGQQGLPHWMRPECRPVPTAVALGSRAAAAPPAAQPPPPPAPAAATVVPPAPDDFEAWLDVELQAPFSVFGEADDVGFGLIAQHSMQELDDGMQPLAEHRDRDGDNDTDAWMLAEIYAPPPEPQPLLLEPWPERSTQRGRKAGVPVRRTRDRSPPHPGRRPPVRAPRFEVEALQQGVLEVETLLEPHEQPPARRATPFHAADGFNVEPYLCDGPGTAEDPSPAGAPSGWRADVPGPQEDSGGAKAAAEVGFARVQAAALFDGMRPQSSGARNLQDLLQLRCRNAAAPPEPQPLPRQPPPEPQWPPEPPSPKWAADAPGADIEVPEPPGPGAFGLLEAHIEDPMEGPAFADDFMDLLGSDIDLGPDVDGGAFMVTPQATA
eukprot:jgi/Ulvmu1/12332/UM089_0016.1